MLKDLTQLVFSCTEYEAGRLGKFLNETLEQLATWKNDEALYEKVSAAGCLAHTRNAWLRARLEPVLAPALWI